MYLCESQKYDMEFECRKKDFEVRVGDTTLCLTYQTCSGMQKRSICVPFLSKLIKSLDPVLLNAVVLSRT